MKIYIAGNTPDREREELELIDKGIIQNRLLSYFYIIVDDGIAGIFKLLIR